MAIAADLYNRLLNYISLKPAFQESRPERLSCFTVLPPIASAGFPATELAVAGPSAFLDWVSWAQANDRAARVIEPSAFPVTVGKFPALFAP